MTTLHSGSAGRDYTISDVTRLLGVTRSWILVREESGHLPAPRRTTGGHRIYNSKEIAEIRALAVESGLSIPETAPPARKGPYVPSGCIAIINKKGGVGKTTITQNLGFALGRMGCRVLLVDIDPQANLSSACGYSRPEEAGVGYAILRESQGSPNMGPILERSLQPTQNPNVTLFFMDRDYGEEAEQELRSERQYVQGPHYLRILLEPLSGDYDFVLFDCPPNLGVLTVNALVAADALIIPIDHDLSMRGVRSILTLITKVEKSYLKRLQVLGAVLNKFEHRTVVGKYIEEQVEEHYGATLFRARIPQTSKIIESHTVETPLVEYAPKHPAAMSFHDLAGEVLERLRAMHEGAAR